MIAPTSAQETAKPMRSSAVGLGISMSRSVVTSCSISALDLFAFADRGTYQPEEVVELVLRHPGCQQAHGQAAKKAGREIDQHRPGVEDLGVATLVQGHHE